MRSFFVKVPTKTYLRKYKETLYGSGAIRVNQDTVLGNVLYMCLSRKVLPTTSKNYLEAIVKGYQDQFLAAVSDYKIFQRRLELEFDHEAILMVNRHLEHSFAMDLHNYCKINVDISKRRAGRDACIEQFAEFHGIELEEDISFEALKKAEYRVRMKLEALKTGQGIFHHA